MKIKNPLPGIKEMFGKPNRNFKIFTTIILLIVLVVLYWIFWPSNTPVDPIISPPPAEVVRLRDKVRSLKEDISSEEKKTAEALAEVDRLKEYQVTLLDSIQKLQPKPDNKPAPKKDEKKTVTTGTGRRKPGNNCKCPPTTRANTETAWAKYGTPTQ